MDCASSKAIVGAATGVLLASLSLLAIYWSSDVVHYATVALYLTSPFFAHLPASWISRSKCSIREGIFFYLSITFISWIAVFNLVYVAFKAF
ncbi:MAG: hypothetical protein QXT76_03230 [Sulfolobales archaeon]